MAQVHTQNGDQGADEISMSNLKLIGREVMKDGRKIIETTLVPKPSLCKECKKNQRQQSSSRCQGCSNAYKVQKYNEGRLQKKMTQQIKN